MSEELKSPERIWAKVHGASTDVLTGRRGLLGGWNEHQREGQIEYVRADLAAAECNGRLRERIRIADWAENTAFDGYLDGGSAEHIAQMIRALPLPPSTSKRA